MDEPRRAASAEAFRSFAREPVYLDLPVCGLRVEVRRATLVELAREGILPNRIAGIVLRQIGIDVPKQDRHTSVEEATTEVVEMVDATCCAVLVAPRMSRDGADPEAIRPEDLAYADREHIFRFTTGQEEDAGALARFREQPDGDVAALANGAGVPGDAPE